MEKAIKNLQAVVNTAACKIREMYAAVGGRPDSNINIGKITIIDNGSPTIIYKGSEIPMERKTLHGKINLLRNLLDIVKEIEHNLPEFGKEIVLRHQNIEKDKLNGELMTEIDVIGLMADGDERIHEIIS